jgi:hypothetical protein
MLRTTKLLLITLCLIAFVMISPVFAADVTTYTTSPAYINTTIIYSGITSHNMNVLFYYNTSGGSLQKMYEIWSTPDESGTYTIPALAVSNYHAYWGVYPTIVSAGGSDNVLELFDPNYVYNIDPPVASFTVTPEVAYPNTIFWANSTSSNYPTEFLWVLQQPDGFEVTTNTNPTGFYASAIGHYNLSLKATNYFGFDWENKTAAFEVVNSSDPVTSISTNVTVKVMIPDGNPISGATVKITTIGGANTTATTNAYGNATFNDYIHYPTIPVMFTASKTDYTTTTAYDEIANAANWYRTLYIATGGGNGTGNGTINITPTPTLPPTDNWYMTFLPDAINLGEDSEINIGTANISKMQDARRVLYYENDNLGENNFRLFGVYNYNLTTSVWDFRENNTAAWIYGTDWDNYAFHIMAYPDTTGIYTYQAAIFGVNSVALGTATGDLPIGTQGGESSGLVMKLVAMDASTSNHLSNYQLTLSDDYGMTHVYDVPYEKLVSLQRGGIYTVTGHKEGYIDSTKIFTVPVDTNIQAGDGGAIVTIEMFQEGTTSAGNCTVTVHVNDAETYYPVGNVRIQVTGQIDKFTGVEGESASFLIPENAPITITASKEGYCSVIEHKNTTSVPYLYVPMSIKYGACAGVTPTHTTIPITITPTQTPIGGYGQLNGTVTVCNRTAVFTGDVAGYIKNQLACLGISDLLSQNLAFACLIILALAIIGAAKAKGIGFAIGAIIGAVLSMAMNLIPFWLVALLVVLTILVVVLLVAKSSGG